MGNLAHASLLLFGVLASGAASAACTVSADENASERSLNPTVQSDADLIASLSIVPKLTHVDYKSAARRPKCDLGPLAADGAYEVWGDDSAGRQRKAIPTKKGEPVALVMPVFDVMKAIDNAKQGKPAATEGFLLATVAGADLTGWRFYTAMPDLTVLKHDMADALGGTGTPIFRNSGNGKTAIFLPKP